MDNNIPAQSGSTMLTNRNVTLLSIFLALIALGLGAAWVLIPTPKAIENNQNTEDSSKETGVKLAAGQTNPDIVGFGQTFECNPRSDHEYYRTDQTLVIDPTNPQVMYVNGEYLGFHKSADGGKTWKRLEKGIPVYARNEDKNEPCYAEYPYALIDPNNTDRIILALSGAGGTPKDMNALSSGIVESLDGGETWKRIIRDDMNGYVSSITIDPSNPSTVYYGSNSSPASYIGADQEKSFVKEGLVYKLKDGEWTELKTGFFPYTGATGVHVNPNNSEEIIVFTLSAPKPEGGSRSAIGVEQMGILRSLDGGETWSADHTIPGDSEAVIVHDVSKTNFNNIWLVPFGSTSPKSYYSTDSGKSFKPTNRYIDFAKYDPNFADGSRLVGYAWQGVNGPTVNRLFESTDSGATWHEFGTLPAEIINIGDKKTLISNIVWDPLDSNTFYMSGASALVWKTTDNGQSWTKLADYNTFLALQN